MYTRVTCEVMRMTHEAASRTVFPAKKGTKRHSKHLVSVSMCKPRHLDGIPKECLLAVSYPLTYTILGACLHGGREPQVGEVTRLIVVENKTRLHIILQPRGSG